MEPLQIYAALFTTIFFNSLITGAIVCHYHQQIMKALALNLYQRGLITAAELLPSPPVPQKEEIATGNRAGRLEIVNGTAEYEEIYKSVRAKC
jgi:hypothetical protein